MVTGARLGAGRLAVELERRGDRFSRATVGRMLAKVRKRCPLCKRRDGHDEMLHAFAMDRLEMETRTLERRHYDAS